MYVDRRLIPIKISFSICLHFLYCCVNAAMFCISGVALGLGNRRDDRLPY
jgi:hypothetical protein